MCTLKMSVKPPTRVSVFSMHILRCVYGCVCMHACMHACVLYVCSRVHVYVHVHLRTYLLKCEYTFLWVLFSSSISIVQKGYKVFLHTCICTYLICVCMYND